MLGPFTDFADASIQYGFATMFIVAYPLATVLSFVNNYIRCKAFLSVLNASRAKS